ncbi:TorF family putative porin [Thiohalomonas denitrificans]|uniref:Histidine kinase n=1 Tax=Thiohalomonas denitrificans TaxID=415747 RepID=A0A1G5QZ48_9GAMM|nr:TorF family putative porin [Thiohalomonas denitrificans]SCZ66997.1 conserved hypothetical protein [Thiohalomonas denitrificans]
MSKLVKTVIAASVATVALGSGVAMAEVSANIGATSNYIWRGLTQTDDQAAISGGLDYEAASGFYLGTWASNLDGGNYELDLYAGFSGEAGSIGYDLGAIHYAYPIGDDELDFTELYGSLGFGPVTGSVAYTVDSEAGGDDSDLYYSLSGDIPLKEDLFVGVLAGRYDFDAADAEDYTHFQLALTKSAAEFGDFTFAVDKTDLDEGSLDDPRVSVSWNKSLDL